MDWSKIDLVVFDVDGTLYDQRRLRMKMLTLLLLQAMRSRSLRVPMVLREFRRFREDLGDDAAEGFLERQYELTAARCGCSAEDVRALALEWIEQRPLTHLGACVYPGVRELFDALATSGRRIAAFSDYPAVDKLEALGLKCDLVVSSTDDDVGRLKPDPAGLRKILERFGAKADRSVMIGDRFDRDWEAARRAGVSALIRSRKPSAKAPTFRTYTDEVFQPLLRREPPLPR